MELGMNHAGEISTLVAIAEPDVRVWTNVGDAHLGFFASPDAIADAKAEILERADADDVLVCNADDPRVMARAARFAGRTVTFGECCRRDGPRARHRGSRHRRHARACRDAGRRARHRDAAARTRQPGERARGHRGGASSSASRSTTSPRVAAALRPADRRGAVAAACAAASRSSTTPTTRARRRCGVRSRWSRTRARARERLRCSARCSSSASTRSACTKNAAAPPRPPACTLLFAVGGAPARARSPTRRSLPACRARRCRVFRQRARRPRRRSRRRFGAGDLVLVKGSRGTRTDLVADRHRGGARLMLYYLLPHLATAPFSACFNVTRYITFRTAAASLTALAHQPRCSAPG